jgi:serine/threonine protein kinase
MHSTANQETLLTIIRAVSPDAADSGPAEEELLDWSSYHWSRLLLHLPTDAHSFLGRFERPWDAVIDDLHQWCGMFRTRPESFQQRFEQVFGYLGLALITLVSLRHSDAYRHPRKPARAAATHPSVSHDCAALCVPMLEESAVRTAIGTLYGPDVWIPEQEPREVESDASTRAEWARIDLDSLRFHRHGTTSFILAGLPSEAAHGRRRPLALKCLVYPFLRVPTIVRATRGYLSQYGMPSRDLQHVARVWASHASWILMDFVPGDTLAEHLQRPTGRTATQPALGQPTEPPRRRSDPERELRIDLLADLGRELFAAMADLERAGLRHCDLSPANIIVARDDSGRTSFVLIDLGINYLYTHAVPGLEGPDARYVAPEIRAGGTSTDKTDLYSVGQLLIAATSASNPSDGSVPDRFYAETPVMARFIEDLIDNDPSHRLSIFRPEPTRPLYPQLRRFFDEELAAMTAARAERASWGPRWLTSLLNLFTPLAGAPARQRRMWKIRRTQGLYRDPRRGMHVRWLLLWSWISASAWYVAATVLVIWWLRDLRWDWSNQAIALLQRATGTPQDKFPYLDQLRQPDYPIPDLAGNLHVRMVGMSFLMVGARYYQNLFAGLTPLIAGLRQGRLSLLAILAETQMRLFSIMAFVLVMPPTLIQRDWWPIFTATGILFTFLCNWICLSFARSAVRRAKARHLSTVPTGRIAGLEAFSDWTPSAAFYTSAVWTIGLLVYFGLVRDVYVYAGAVTAINTVLFYVIKCSGNSAADVRIGLGRACLAAERLRYTSERQPPRQRSRTN